MRNLMFISVFFRPFKSAVFVLILVSSLLPIYAHADLVKPALIEIVVEKSGQITVEARVSIEALLTGINARYKNTQDAPSADEYDFYREMPPDELMEYFESFKQEFLDRIYIRVDGKKLPLAVGKVEIPPTGYTRVPRISVVYLKGQLPENADSLEWYYPAKFGDNAVRVKQVDRKNEQWYWSQWQWIKNDKVSRPFSLREIVARQSTLEVVANYIAIGFEHIIPIGMDHILFILGLFLLSTKWRPLLWQATMFTIAHTITLGLATTGYINLPERIVQPLIALSIAYVGVENVLSSSLKKSRLVVVFLFGLLHGVGFAGALNDFGMPDDEFFTALISFNVGVEIGQITVICMAFLGIGIWFNNERQYRRLVVIPGSLLISFIGLYWFWERLQLF
jgi:hydrogenase/urease accessory protein HupE